MRATKVMMVALTMAASLVVGVGGSASAAPAPVQTTKTLWCC
jgi:hypothetical protein